MFGPFCGIKTAQGLISNPMQASHAWQRDVHKLQECAIGFGRGNRPTPPTLPQPCCRQPFDSSRRGRPGGSVVLVLHLSILVASTDHSEMERRKEPICPHAIPGLQTCSAPIPPSLPTRHGLLPLCYLCCPYFPRSVCRCWQRFTMGWSGVNFLDARRHYCQSGMSIGLREIETWFTDTRLVCASLSGEPESTQVSLSM
ncbi:hypothetical protein IWZ03DRAFT_106076 [Phyllosticta citriasiana]|uniref:Uncharacterized protein n=1 Tax=Phyllosticta citriasiana TaxID=595635 RepID=A0ABR1KUU8_9PEZI